jgi:hypothetical protein
MAKKRTKTSEHFPQMTNKLRNRAAREPKIGERMPTGVIYAGKSMYVMPADAPLTMTFSEAQKYAESANAQKAYGHGDWRVPTKSELNDLFNNRAAIGGFREGSSDASVWYWSSSSRNKDEASCQRFSDGYRLDNGYRPSLLSLRLVR